MRLQPDFQLSSLVIDRRTYTASEFKMDLKITILLFVGLTSTCCVSCPICGEGHPELDAQLDNVRGLAVQWLAGQQNVDGSWPNVNTQNAILGLQLADPDWLANQSLDDKLLTISRLEYELMQYLLSWRSSSCRSPVSELGLNGGRLGQYILALKSACGKINDFYGNDLGQLMVRLLREQDSFTNFFQYSLGILSQCSCNQTISRKALVKLAKGDDRYVSCASQFGGHSIDILSLQVMAMVCANEQAIKNNVNNWEAILEDRVQCIIDAQNENGAFGNAITTTLAVQALTAANITQSRWACVDSIEFLLSSHTNGDFGGVGATAQIIPFLGCNNFGSLKEERITCPSYVTIPSPPTLLPGDDTVTFDIEVKVGEDVQTNSVTILNGENVYYGMIRLADLNNSFTFETKDSAFGQFILSFNGVSQDRSRSLYWTIRIRIGNDETSAPKGVEGLFPSEGETYIFILTDFS